MPVFQVSCSDRFSFRDGLWKLWGQSEPSKLTVLPPCAPSRTPKGTVKTVKTVKMQWLSLGAFENLPSKWGWVGGRRSPLDPPKGTTMCDRV
eukprot:16441145-Heterocapsa_arctica.AAC.1